MVLRRFQPWANCPTLECVSTTTSSNESPSGLVEDLIAMGQVEPNLDLLIAMLVQRNLWTLKRIPKDHSTGTKLCCWAQ